MTVPFSDDELILVAAEFNAEDAFWGDSLNLEILLGVAQGCGVLSDLSIAQVLDADSDCFLGLVEISQWITVCSPVIRWDDVRPDPKLFGTDAVRHVLPRLAEIAEKLRAQCAAEIQCACVSSKRTTS